MKEKKAAQLFSLFVIHFERFISFIAFLCVCSVENDIRTENCRKREIIKDVRHKRSFKGECCFTLFCLNGRSFDGIPCFNQQEQLVPT